MWGLPLEISESSLGESGDALTPGHLAEKLRVAEELGFEVVQSTSTTLLLDLDTPAAHEQYQRVLPLVKEKFVVKLVEEWTSKSGNLHVRIVLDVEQPFITRLLLQAALGSDGKREILSMLQHRWGCEEPSFLFKPKGNPDAKPR